MASSSRSWKYDVFLSFRGEDTRKTFVDHLYSALQRCLIRTYKDDKALPRGDTIGPSLLNAIDESQIAVIIFSENYANSSWCLDELEYIMKCKNERGKIVMPIFYGVEPSEVRKQKRKYEEAFTKHELENNRKVESWRKALFDATNIAGWETKYIANGHEAKGMEDIVGTILDKLLSSNSVVDKNLVGMGTRLQDLKSQLQIGSGGVRMVGIWGMGGGGKTTLASSLYMEIRSNFDSSCFVGSIREESSKHGMQTLQEKIISTVFDKELKVESVDIGKITIGKMLCCRNVLIVLDDVDDCKHLEALAGSHDWFGEGSRIIITTRDEHVLITHRVDEVSHISLLSDEEANRLFDRCAYNKNNLVEEYKTLSQRVVSYAGGLPLAIKIVGKFLYDKNKDEWISTLNRLKDNPEMEIVEKLKISYDGLKPIEKELFLDIACFCRGMWKDEAMVMLDACGFHPDIGVRVLIQKGLITIFSNALVMQDVFEMHDLLQEMGHFIVIGEHPNNPEKRSRLWRFQEIEEMCSRNAITENDITEAIQYRDNCPSSVGKLVSNAKKLRLLSLQFSHEGDIEGPDYLSNELKYMFWKRYPASPFPKSFHPRKLVVLKLESSLQEELWTDYMDLPCLKELYVGEGLVRTPDFGGLPCLQKLTLFSCDKLEVIHPSLGNHKSLVSVSIESCKKLKEFPTIVQMGKLEILDIFNCTALSKFPKIEGNMDSLVNLSLDNVWIEAVPSTVGKYCTKLRSLKLECSNLKSIEGNFHALNHLQKCIIHGDYRERCMMPKDLFNKNNCLEELSLSHLYPQKCTRQPYIRHLPRLLRRLALRDCRLEDGEIPCDIGELSNLQVLDLGWNEFSRLNVSLLQLSQLKLLNLECCENLDELPKLPTSIAILEANGCYSLELVGDIHSNCKWLCQVSLRNVRSVIGGDRLLQTMLQGHPIENGCMRLDLKGVEIPKGFIPRLLSGNRYRLELPENWYIHFSGFLICGAMKKNYNWSQLISMKHVKGGMDFQEEVYWEESAAAAAAADDDDDDDNNDDGDEKGGMDSQEEEEDIDDGDETLVLYISFGLLKHTFWWDLTSTAIEFSFEGGSCIGFGVCLVSQSEKTITDFSSESSNDYTLKFLIEHDSKSDLKCRFLPYWACIR